MRYLVKAFVGAIAGLGPVAAALAQPGIPWSATFEGAKDQAAQSGRLVMVHFWAPWCPVCLDTERDVYSQPSVAATVRATSVAVKVNHDESPELAARYGVRRLPTVVVLAPDGTPLDRVEGRVTPQQLSDRLKRQTSPAMPSGHRQAVHEQPTLQHHSTRPPAGIQPTHQNPPLGLDGYCAVSLSDDLLANRRRWVPGSKAHGVIHRGRTYLFADAEKAARFFQDPDRYAPILSGRDVVAAIDEGRAAEGRRRHGAFFGNRVYLFSSEATLQRFEDQPNRYADSAVRLSARTPRAR